MAEGHSGYEPTSVDIDDYITINSGFTVNQKYAYWVAPNLVFICLDLGGTFDEGQTVIGTATNKVFNQAYIPGRVTATGWKSKPATGVIISGGQVRVHTDVAGIAAVLCGFIIVH